MNTNRIKQANSEEYDLFGLTALEELVVILAMATIVSVLCVCSLLIAGAPVLTILNTISGFSVVVTDILRAAGAAAGF